MANLAVNNLMESNYDADMNEMTLIFEADGKRIFARGTAPEGSFDDERYFDSEKNVQAFLKDASIEEED